MLSGKMAFFLARVTVIALLLMCISRAEAREAERPPVKRDFLSDQTLVATLVITVGIILPMVVYFYIGIILIPIAYTEFMIWTARNATRNPQVIEKKKPEVLKKLSDSGPRKPLPVLKSIDQKAMELLSSVIDVSMKDLPCAKKRPTAIKKLSGAGPVKPVLKSVDEKATEILSSVIDISMKELRCGWKRPTGVKMLSGAGPVKLVLKSIDEKATEILSSVIDISMKELRCALRRPTGVKKLSESGPVKPMPVVKGVRDPTMEPPPPVIEVSKKDTQTKSRAAQVHALEERPVAKPVDQIATQMLASVMSTDPKVLTGCKDAMASKTMVPLSCGVNTTGQLAVATEGSCASRKVDLDMEVVGMGVFFQL